MRSVELILSRSCDRFQWSSGTVKKVERLLGPEGVQRTLQSR
jgi:hypothetical protein